MKKNNNNYNLHLFKTENNFPFRKIQPWKRLDVVRLVH